MVTRVDFAFGAPDRLRMACQVIGRHYAKGRKVVVYCSDARLLNRFDRLLWSFDPASFIPHVSTNDTLASVTPVLLATQVTDPLPWPDRNKENNDLAPWLLNLDQHCPASAEKFERILEIVSNEQSDRQFARQRWAGYKAAGLELHAHDVSGMAHAT